MNDVVARSSRAALLVIMPALNEAATIASVIARVPRSVAGIDSITVLVVDDGSVDDTAQLARQAGAVVISHGKNLGVGSALQTGLDEATRRNIDFAVNVDSDGQFAPEDMVKLLEPLLNGAADFATASRFKDRALAPAMPKAKRLGNWGMAKIVSAILGQKFDDVSCGFRAYTRETILQLVLSGTFTYTQETLLLLGQKGLRMVEVPLAVRGEREYGQSRVASSLLRYAYRTVGIMFSCVRDFSPGAIFNLAALVLSVLSLGFAAFFVWHRVVAGQFTPHIWAGFMAAFLFGLSFMTFALGQVASMVARLRRLNEKQLYILRKHLDRDESDRSG